MLCLVLLSIFYDYIGKFVLFVWLKFLHTVYTDLAFVGMETSQSKLKLPCFDAKINGIQIGILVTSSRSKWFTPAMSEFVMGVKGFVGIPRTSAVNLLQLLITLSAILYVNDALVCSSTSLLCNLTFTFIAFL